MALLALLANVLGFAAFGTFIWLVVLAFRRSPGWGLAVLFLSPIAAIVFAVKFWSEAKRPFLATTGSTLGMFLVMVLLVGQLGGFGMLRMMREAENGEISQEQAAQFIDETMDKWQDSGLLDARQQAELREARAAFERQQRDGGAGDDAVQPNQRIASPSGYRFASTPEPPLRASAREGGASERSSGSRAAHPRFGYVSIPFREAGSHLGKPCRIVEKDGRKFEGTLAEADGDSLWVERFLSGGTVVLELPEREIDTLSVFFR